MKFKMNIFLMLGWSKENQQNSTIKVFIALLKAVEVLN